MQDSHKNKIIQKTNNASIVSKRSAEYSGYPFSKNQYLRAFVKKPKRRSPVINRGYYIRCKAIDTVIQNFLSEKNNLKKVIINLGCGYDPLPFRYISESTFDNVLFFDIDFPDLIKNKKSIIKEDHELKKMSLKQILSSKNQLILQYQLIGCNLEDLDSLKIILKEKCPDLETMNILFISEVAMVYMETNFSDKVINWASFFPYASFVILEQILPSSKNHPFGKTMISYFNKLKTPLYSLDQYPTLESQYKRFLNKGWKNIEAFDLCTFWYYGIDKETKDKVNLTEEFDEWEEIILFLQHYCLLIAKNFESEKQILLNFPPKGFQYLNSDEQTQFLNNHIFNNFDSNFLVRAQKISGNGSFHRKFGATTLFNRNSIIYHGGISESGRDGKIFIITYKGNIVHEFKAEYLGIRVCHTLDYFSQDNILFCVGGRESPCKLSSSEQEFNRLTQNTLKTGHCVNRYRHGMVKVTLQEETRYILFGGNEKTCQLADKEWMIWSQEKGWEFLETNSKNKMQPRSGMCMIWLPERKEGIICGGMDKNGVICEDIWTFKINIFNKKWVLELIPWSNLSILDIQHISRFGAKAVNVSGILDGNVLITGGVSMFHCISWNDQFILLDLDNQKITPLDFQILEDEPILIGFDIIRIDNSIIILGGGCMCFSFGTYWNNNILTLFESNLSKEWLICEHKITKTGIPNSVSKYTNYYVDLCNLKIQNSINPEIKNISSVKIKCENEWKKILEENIPIVLKGLNVGTCIKKWTPEYLISHIGYTRKIIVHNARTDFMNFHAKNFNYETMNFGEFINSIYKDEKKLYMRSISTKNPRTKPSLLEEDFFEISSDFRIPPELSQIINPNKFSSPLRISSKNIGMWLHYDVMSNILIQIRGSKKIRLYPPSDILYLEFPPGSSSSRIPNIFIENSIELKNTHPYEVNLFPGDILYIPPFWLHAIYSLEPSISVNVFWRHLESQYYATITKDVYGNRDLKPYEISRNLIKKIVENFKGLSRNERKFYLERLGAELIEASKT
ncbi:hypothetical protein PMAC_002314 [Pneumocystis sp. 'macacae']|nr:hypothetical protein PMAC_002314 [Pneumocystis sp. 'macacae']